MSVRGALVTVFGLGHLRPASGTWGSTPPPAIALALVWWLGRDGLTNADGWTIAAVMVALGVAFSIVCVAFGRWAESRYGRKDPGQVVADEVAGQSIALLALPWRPMTDTDGVIWNLAVAATAFLAFRLLDIIKPPPADRLQSLPAGWGILVDDLLAGVYALAVTQALTRLALPAIL